MDNDFLLNSGIPLHLESSSSSPAGAPMDESFLPSIWDTQSHLADISPHSRRLLPTPPPNLTSADPGFAERAARFSCFGSRSFNGRTHLNSGQFRSNPFKMSRVSSSPSLHHLEEPTVSEQTPIGENENALKPNSRKRKTISKATTQPPKGDGNSNAKRSKAAQEEDEKKKQRAAEAPKDYIHVRARRGQATDSHSLAERVRREKISERMKLLQDLVPGCNKVTGKALMLDEIINYVQSLQGQVEFLSMKLASVNTPTSPNMDSLVSKSKDMFQSNNTSTMCPSSFFGHQNEALHGTPNQSPVDPLDSELCRNLGLHLSQVDGLGEGALQYPRFCQDDLQSIVQMGFAHNVHGSTQEPSPMKIEL